MNLKRITIADEFAASAGPWEALRAEAGAANPFLAHDWLVRWGQSCAPGRQTAPATPGAATSPTASAWP